MVRALATGRKDDDGIKAEVPQNKQEEQQPVAMRATTKKIMETRFRRGANTKNLKMESVLK